MIRPALIALCLIATPVAASDLASVMLAKVGQSRPAGCPKNLWCQCSLNITLKQAGYKGTGSNRAIDTARYGLRASGPSRGVLGVMRHHVGVVIGMCGKGVVKMVSGNSGNPRRVKVGCYPMSRFVAFRRAVK